MPKAKQRATSKVSLPREEVAEQFAQSLEAVCDNSEGRFSACRNEGTDFERDLGLGSEGRFQLASQLWMDFGIEVPDRVVGGWKVIGDGVTWMHKRLDR